MSPPLTAPRLLVTVLFAGAAPALAAAPKPATGPASCPGAIDVRNVMTVNQFGHAGLDKLSKEQLAALNRWLSGYVASLCNGMRASTAATKTGATPSAQGSVSGNTKTGSTQSPSAGAAVTGSESAFGQPPAPVSGPNRIESRIVGQFHGWTGDTVFRLQNGQVWKQAGPGYFETDLKNPKVVIKKLLIGYVLLVDGYGKEVFVRRIR